MIQTVFCIIFFQIWKCICVLLLKSWHASETTTSAPLEMSRTWVKQGAAVIGELNGFLLSDLCLRSLMKSLPVGPPGGCCRISPAHIATLRRHLKGSQGSPSSNTPSTNWQKGRCYFPDGDGKSYFYWKINEVLHQKQKVRVCVSCANISCTQIRKGTMQLWFHSLTDGDSTLGLYTFKYRDCQHDSNTVGFTTIPQHWNVTPFSPNAGRTHRAHSVYREYWFTAKCVSVVCIADRMRLLGYTDTARRCTFKKKREMCFCFLGWKHGSCRENSSHSKQDSWRVGPYKFVHFQNCQNLF